MTKKEITQIEFQNQHEWREWLEENHEIEASVWVVMYTKKAPKINMTWSEAVDEALCFGWIDSVRKSIDEISFKQFFSKRRANGTWSKVNKEKVEMLISSGLMREAGLKAIEIAKNNGSWMILDTVDALIVPEDLKVALDEHDGANDYFESLSKSMKKQLLYWIISAKRPETRMNRIEQIAENAGNGRKPRSFS